jgi:hypothetical protein
MGFYIDTKLTIWDRMEFESEEQMLEAKALLESGELKSGLDVSDHFELSAEIMLDTQEELTPEENNGLATLQIFNENGDTIWHNGTDEHYFERLE